MVVVVITLLFFTPMLYYIPKSVLGGVIVVAFSNIFGQIGESVRFWKRDRLEFSVWFITFASVLIFDVVNGLYMSISWSLLVTSYRYFFPRYRIQSNLGLRYL